MPAEAVVVDDGPMSSEAVKLAQSYEIVHQLVDRNGRVVRGRCGATVELRSGQGKLPATFTVWDSRVTCGDCRPSAEVIRELVDADDPGVTGQGEEGELAALAADGADVPDGVEAPSVEEQLAYLEQHGWPSEAS